MASNTKPKEEQNAVDKSECQMYWVVKECPAPAHCKCSAQSWGKVINWSYDSDAQKLVDVIKHHLTTSSYHQDKIEEDDLFQIVCDIVPEFMEETIEEAQWRIEHEKRQKLKEQQQQQQQQRQQHQAAYHNNRPQPPSHPPSWQRRGRQRTTAAGAWTQPRAITNDTQRLVQHAETMLANHGQWDDQNPPRAVANRNMASIVHLQVPSMQPAVDADSPVLPPMQTALLQLDKALRRAQNSALQGQQMAFAFMENLREEAYVFASAREAVMTVLDTFDSRCEG